MLADPLSITIGGVTHSLARIKVGDLKATYSNADQTLILDISHQQSGKGNSRIRTQVKLTQSKVVTDPLTSVTDTETMSESRVVDRPNYGFTKLELESLIGGFNTFFTANTNANIGKLWGLES
jgi:hypothetical protein